MPTDFRELSVFMASSGVRSIAGTFGIRAGQRQVPMGQRVDYDPWSP
jgi:hypothetical protein